jgi:FKBP-type peptidyl-prolyl cis-trans isomerase 2
VKRILFALAIALLLLGCASQNPAKPSDSNGTTTPNVAENKTANAKNQTGGVGLKAENGDLVAVDYIGSLDNGTVFDTSIKDEAVKAKLPLRTAYAPLEFTVGAGQMISGFDKAVVGMAKGEEKKIHIPAAEAYGEKKSDFIITVPKANAPEGVEKGAMVAASNGMPGLVLEVTADNVTIDFNHPLAGQALNFRITMKKITKK